MINFLLERYTSWYKLKRKRGIAWICKIRRKLLRNGRYESGEIDNNLKSDNTHKIIVHDMLDAESVVLKFVQTQVYTEQVCALNQGQLVKCSSSFRQLDP